MNCGDCVHYVPGTTPDDIRSKRGTCVAPYSGWAANRYEDHRNVWAIEGHTFNHADTCAPFKLRPVTPPILQQETSDEF